MFGSSLLPPSRQHQRVELAALGHVLRHAAVVAGLDLLPLEDHVVGHRGEVPDREADLDVVLGPVAERRVRDQHAEQRPLGMALGVADHRVQQADHALLERLVGDEARDPVAPLAVGQVLGRVELVVVVLAGLLAADFDARAVDGLAGLALVRVRRDLHVADVVVVDVLGGAALGLELADHERHRRRRAVLAEHLLPGRLQRLGQLLLGHRRVVRVDLGRVLGELQRREVGLRGVELGLRDAAVVLHDRAELRLELRGLARLEGLQVLVALRPREDARRACDARERRVAERAGQGRHAGAPRGSDRRRDHARGDLAARLPGRLHLASLRAGARACTALRVP